mgnify:CR=1 FL=1
MKSIFSDEMNVTDKVFMLVSLIVWGGMLVFYAGMMILCVNKALGIIGWAVIAAVIAFIVLKSGGWSRVKKDK